MNDSILIKISQTKNKLILFGLAFLTTVSTPTHAEILGRLFTTPNERAMLERLRHAAPSEIETQKMSDTELDKTAPDPEALSETLSTTKTEIIVIEEKAVEPDIIILPAQKIPNITVNGFVKRSGGKSTAWVNGINTNDGYFEPQHIKVNPRRVGHDHVHIEVDDLTIGDVSLKAGQTLNPTTSEVTETYQTIGHSDAQ